MDALQSNYKDDPEEEHQNNTNPLQNDTELTPPRQTTTETSQNDESIPQNDTFVAPLESLSDTTSNDTEKPTPKTEEIEEDYDDVLDEENEENPPNKKQKKVSEITKEENEEITENPGRKFEENAKNGNVGVEIDVKTPTLAKKKSKKKNNNNVWVTRSTRKGKKKTKPNSQNGPNEDTVLITPVQRVPDKSDDSPELSICLSKVYKAEKVELSEDRLSAGSSKGYRMVRATRGVCEGPWFFEIKLVSLGETGHTRLGFSTEKGDLQAPVGYDGNSYGYRDVDGSKVHKALREKYGEEGYKEGDVIGFYINLPDGEKFAPKPNHLVWYKGQRYALAPDVKEDPPQIVPGSEISFFKNGVCQGVAFKDLYGGRYHPSASMYTLPNQPNCVVKFKFGPDFECFPKDFGGRPVPKPMIDVPYHGFDSGAENGVSDEKKT